MAVFSSLVICVQQPKNVDFTITIHVFRFHFPVYTTISNVPAPISKLPLQFITNLSHISIREIHIHTGILHGLRE